MVPFHLGKHKAVAIKRAAFGLKLRLQVAGFGVAAVLIGWYLSSRGVLFVIDLHGMPAYSAALIAVGGILLSVALIPTRWIEKTAAWLLSSHKPQRSHL